MIDPAKLAAAMTASGGRWRVTPDLYHADSLAIVDESELLVLDGRSRTEVQAIVRVHNSVPDLLDEIKRLTAQVERVRELHDDGVWECANPQHTDPSVGCPECREICMSCGYDCPCPTIRALDADALPDAIRQAKAEGWDEGYTAGHEDARAVQPTYPQPTPNPYRQARSDR